MQNRLIPVCEPFLNGDEKSFIIDAVDSGWISSAGEYINRFEEGFANYLGVNNAVTVSSGTAALHVALLALGIKTGDEVIIPDFTMIASAFAVVYTGANPVFVDSDISTWNIDPRKIEEKITPRTKAIMAVHIYGHPCEMDEIISIANKYNLAIIEDAAEVHGAKYKEKYCGSLGHISCFSFFANKIITTGEGGMIATNDSCLADKCRYFKNLCFPLSGERKYVHEDIGFNYRMSNLLAAIGLAQLNKIDYYIKCRRDNNDLYKLLLANVPGITFQVEKEYSFNVFWMNGILIDETKFGINRDKLILELRKKGVDSRTFFVGMHNQPALKKNMDVSITSEYPISSYLEMNGLYLPSGSGLSNEDVRYISKVIEEIHAINN